MRVRISVGWKIMLFMIAIFSNKSHTFGLETQTEEFKKSEHIIPKNYLKHTIPPTKNGETIQVNMSMRIFIISSVNFDDMDFSIDMYIKQEWQDTRITVPNEIFEHGEDNVNLPSRIFNNLWQPDLYFLNSKVEEKTTMAHKFSSVTLFKNNTVRLVTRMHAVVACPMEFHYFPMDTQICPIAVESFSYNNHKLMLKWAGSGVTLNPQIRHLQYNIIPLHLEQTNIYTTEKNGNFSRLVVYFAFERQIGHAVIQIFAPSTLIVGLSWFSFWLEFDAIPGRVTLLVTCLLSLVTMFTDLRVETPLVDYIKALDIWMAGCMILVFGAVAEFVIAKVLFVKYNALKKKEARKLIKNTRNSTVSEFLDPNIPEYAHNFRYKYASNLEPVIKLYWITSKGKEKILWQECDKFSRIVFPICFFVFAVIYWTIMIYGRRQNRQSFDGTF